MSNNNNSIKQMYWLNGEWVYVDAENANNLDMLDSTDFASRITEAKTEHASTNILFGNNDWGKLLYNISDNAVASARYDSANQGMAFTGIDKQYGIAIHAPIDPNAIYRISVRVKKVSGNGNFSLGVRSLDNQYTSLGDNFCTANNVNVATVMDVTGRVFGYSAAPHNDKFRNNANYFDIVFTTGQGGTDALTVYVIQSIEIAKMPNDLFVGHDRVWHEGNFDPTLKVDHTYLANELEIRDREIDKKADQNALDLHISTIGGSVTSGHVKNGGNVTINNLGQMNTTPSAIGAYTKAEADTMATNKVNTHANVVAQTGLGHVKNGGNITIAPDGKVNTTPSAIGSYSKEETDDLIAVKLTDKVYVDTHISDAEKHISAAERTKWNAKADASGTTANDFNVKNITIAGNIMPTGNSTQNIGSPTNRFKAIYVDEAYLSTNTLYLGDTPIMGTDADTVNIKTDPDQSICMKTSATGTTTVASEKAVAITTSGMNSNVTIQTTGVNSQANIAATARINLDAPEINFDGNTNVKGDLTARNLNITGDFTVGGTLTTVNATNLEISDNIIDINKGETGQGVAEGMAGIKIDRGDLNDVLLVFDEVDDKFKVGDSANLLAIATEKYVYDNRYIHPSGTNPHGTTKADVGLGNVTNESKTTMFTNPTFTGTPIAPTATDNTNNTQLATTAYVMRESAKKADSSHGNHIPTIQTAHALTFLRNDNTWQTIQNATTGQKGVVQLNNNINSTATDQAATASAVKTTYDYASTKATKDVATSAVDGLMSKADKAKLDSIATGAGTNQNAFSHFKVGATTVSADNATDTVELVAGNGITLTADAATDKITITGVNQYTHPTGDGNLHVPANGTSNSGKFLQATGTAGTYQWSNLPTGSTSAAGILQLGSGATQASPGNHGHNNYLPLSGGTLTGNLAINGSSLTIKTPVTTGGWARGMSFSHADNTVIGGIGALGSGTTLTHLYIGVASENYWDSSVGLTITASSIKWKNNKIYHAGDKPTCAEIGAAPVGHTHTDITDHNHDNTYLKLTGGTVDGKLIVLGTAASESFMVRGIQGSDGNGNNGDLYLNYNNNNAVYVNGANKVYHQGFKPTAADIGASATGHTHDGYLSIAGGTLTGALTLPADKYFNNDVHGINMNNSDIIGANTIIFKDESDGNEGLMWPKAGKLGSSTNPADYDILKSYQSHLYYNTNKVYHEGFKPTAADIGASATGHTHNYAASNHGHSTSFSIINYNEINLANGFNQTNGTVYLNYQGATQTIANVGICSGKKDFATASVIVKECKMGSSASSPKASMRYNESTECIEFYFM